LAILRRLAAAIQPGTRVISVSHVITSTGLRMPIAEIAALARQRGILCVVDGAQAVGAIAVDLRQLNCHAYATSGHKWLLGPKGTGLLHLHPDARDTIQPIQREDGHAFVSHSSGSGSMPLVAGLGTAIEALRQHGMAQVEARGVALRNRAYAGLRQLPTSKLRVVGPPPGPLATPMVAAELDATVDSRQLRDVLQNKHRIIVKMVEKQWFNGIRISPNYLNTEDDVDAVLRALRVELAG
jgi:selenocysteine lyase/cysteine desulfurase